MPEVLSGEGSTGLIAEQLKVSYAGGGPFAHHYGRRVEVVRRLDELANKYSKPCVTIGTLTVDVAVILLTPMKHDWDAFYDMGIADLFVAAERRVQREHEAKHPRLRVSSEPGSRSGLTFFHPSDRAASCPGMRCDGIHFASDFAEYECRTSVAIWDSPLTLLFKEVGLVT
jgi:hypothetical protein